MKDVETLIPHRAPFLYVDRVIRASSEEIEGVKNFSDADEFLSGSFPEFAFVPGMVLVEAMAQCGGAGIKKLGLGSGMFAFAGIEKVLFHKGVPLNTDFVMVISNIKITDKYFKQSGKGYAGDQLCVEGVWICVKIQ